MKIAAGYFPYSKNTGFTLLELMIAMVIFSFMSIMAYGALANILTSDKVITAQEQKLKKLKRTMMFIERDMRQIVARPRSAGFDSKDQVPALVSGFDDEGKIEFTRSGNSNPTEAVRSSLQRIQYEVEEQKLIRKSWNLVDHFDAEPIAVPLLNDVESFDFRFLNKSKAWQENWSENSLPEAIELTLEHKHWGEIIRLFPLQ